MTVPSYRPAALATTLVTLFAFPIAAAQAYTATGDLFLTADGGLERAPGRPGETPCLALTGVGAGRETAAFQADLAPGNFTVAPANLTLLVALGGASGPAQSGSGFDLEAELSFGGTSPPLADRRAFGPGEAPSEAALVFALPAAVSARGPLVLGLALAPSGTVPVGTAQDVRILCDHEGTRIVSFNVETSAALPPTGGTRVPGDPVPPGRVLAFAILAGLATIAAGLLALAGRTISERRVHLLLGATAGLLLALALVDLIPEAIRIEPNARFTVAFGVLGLFLVKWASGSVAHSHAGGSHAGHAHDHPHVGSSPGVVRLALLAFFALGFHRLVDGLVLPAAFQVGGSTGFAAAGAVLVHQFPDGLAGASVFLAAGWTRRRVSYAVAVVAAMTVLGAILGLTVLGLAAFIGHLIGLAAATFIFIALAELLPELASPRFRRVVILGVVLGYGAAFGLEWIAEDALGG